MILNTIRPKVPHICWNTVHESQISLLIVLRLLVFHINWFFPIGYNGEFEFKKKKKRKSSKVRKPKCQKSPMQVWWEPLVGKFRKSMKTLAVIWWRSGFSLLLGPMLMKTIKKIQNFKNPKRRFVGTVEKIIQNRLQFIEEVVFWKFVF